jgi:hypothetical protein
VDQELRVRKSPIYDEFVEFMLSLFLSKGKQMSEATIQKSFVKFTTKEGLSR